MLVQFGHFLSSYHVNVTSCNLCARAKVPGHRELKIEQNPSLVKLVTELTELFNKVCEKV